MANLQEKFQKLRDMQENVKTGNPVKKAAIFPIMLYMLFLLFKLPAGWLCINFLFPMKALAEYSEIHEKILKYIMTRDEMTEETKMHQLLYHELIENLVNRPITLSMMFFFHLVMCTCSTNTVGFFLVSLYVACFIIKLVRYHLFMTGYTDKVKAIYEHPQV